MSDRRIQVFHAVAKHLSFTKAAEALFMTQPAVTFQIRQLEEEFNTRLFDRRRGRVTLTAAGAIALEYSEGIVALSAELKTRMKELGGAIGGPLLVGASATLADFLLPQIIADFKARFPAIVPRLCVANSVNVQRLLLDRGIDIGFIEGISHQPALVSDVVCEDELQVVCPPSHPLVKETRVTPDLLICHHYISREAGSGTRGVIDQYLQDAGLSPGMLQIVMEAGSAEAIKGLMVAGMGYSIMSTVSVEKETRLGNLVTRPLLPKLTRHLFAIYPKERMHSRLVVSFLTLPRSGWPEWVQKPHAIESRADSLLAALLRGRPLRSWSCDNAAVVSATVRGQADAQLGDRFG
jgi:DNA-binding transcriptional LysR family regulator